MLMQSDRETASMDLPRFVDGCRTHLGPNPSRGARTQLVNMIRGQLAEFGINIPQGLERALMLARQIIEGKVMP